ncbi:MAG: protein kinase, partial [Acidobacteria bacterium]|nr:protein kinase [Acidobacteriota bacterium]
TMEYVEGQDLKRILREKRKLASDEVVGIIRQVCLALDAAHSEGVIHRDLKPQNIMIDGSGRVVVMDFGIARSMEMSGLTQTGALIGTPEYMSPEQAKGEKVDTRSDLFPLGIIFYELLTGTSPYKSDTAMGTLLKRLQERAIPPVQLDTSIPHALSDIVVKCLAIDPNERYQTAPEMLRDLDAWVGGAPTLAAALTAVVPPPVKPAIPAKPGAIKRYGKWAGFGVAVVLLAAAGFLLRNRFLPRQPAQQKPITVLVADFNNATGDPVFNGTLEPIFIQALEGASFINAYNRGAARKIAGQLQPGASKLDEPLARLVAVREGIHYTVAGSIVLEGGAYRLSVRGINATTGKTIATQQVEGTNKNGVMVAVGKLAARIRNALGDDTPEALQLSAAETFTAGSLEAAHDYAMAEELQLAGKFEEAIRSCLRAAELDPDLGRAYAALAANYINMRRRQEAEKYFQMALARIDRMTDREKYRTRGGYYLAVRNHQKAIEEFSALVKQYPADSAGYSNLALAYFYGRDMSRALEEGRRAMELYPKNTMQRNNVALYAMYAGDFETAAREARTALQMTPSFALAYDALALSELAQGRVPQAAEAYRRAETLGAWGASPAAIGLADLALYGGRLADATAILEKAANADLANNNPSAAANKLSTLAYAHLLRGRKAQALAAADRAIASSQDESVLFPAARIYLEAGQESKARRLASELGERLEPDPQAYAKLIEGEAELRRGGARKAIKLFQEAQKLADTWIGRFLLGRAYLDAGAFTEAHSEFELCVKRRGEATAVFLDDVPSYRYLPPVYYYLGRAGEGLKSPGAVESYRTFLAIKEKSDGEPLVADARRRLGGR